MNTSKFHRDVLLGLKSLMLHKLRSLLTMLGVVFGVGSVVAMLSVGEGAGQEALAQIEKLGSRNIVVRSKKPTAEEKSANKANSSVLSYGLLYADLQRIEECYPAIDKVVPAKIINEERLFCPCFKSKICVSVCFIFRTSPFTRMLIVLIST